MGHKEVTRPRKRRARRRGQSPYVRHAKAPFEYSALHKDWARAASLGQVDLARAFADKHHARFLHGVLS